MLKCKKVDILESIKYGILHSTENRTVCAIPDAMLFQALLFFSFQLFIVENFKYILK